MKIGHRRFARVAVLDPAGELSINTEFGALQTAIGNAIDEGTRAVFLGLDAVTRLDCAGIGQLVDLRRRVAAAGRIFGLLGVSPRHREMIEMLRLAAVLGVCDDEAEALRRVDALAGIPRQVGREPQRSDRGVSRAVPLAVPSRGLGEAVGWHAPPPHVARAQSPQKVEEATWPPLL